MNVGREVMSSVDQSWLRMEQDDNLMMITAVMLLAEPMDPVRFRQTVEERLLRFSRFRQRVVMEGEQAFWQADPHFHLDNHLHDIGLPGAADREALSRVAGDLASTPLDRRHPLWTMHYVDHYQADGRSGAALIVRIHHCIADGLALVRVMLTLADDCADGSPPETRTAASLVSRTWQPVERLVSDVRHLSHLLLEEGLDLVRHPGQWGQYARKALGVARELLDISLQPADPPTPLSARRSGRKRVAWSAPLDLDEVKQLAHRLDGTVNDVLLACAAGAVREALLAEGAACDAPLHVAVPFNLRPLDKPVTSLGNQFGLVIVTLPVNEADVLTRFRAVQAHMQQLKRSPQPLVFYSMLALFGRGPEAMERAALEVLSHKASLVMTNVPGPRESLYLGGARVDQPLFWVPQSGAIGVGLSILSYAGGVQFAVIADEALLADPARLCDSFADAFADLAVQAPAP